MFFCVLEGTLRAPTVVKKPEGARNIGCGQKVRKKEKRHLANIL